VVAGTGPLREDLESLTDRLGVRSRVHFLGFQSNVPLVLAALDVYVLSSLCEALPYALLEAMAAKLPVIATTVGGIPEVIEPGVSGLLVPPGRMDALSEGIRRLLRSEGTRSRIGTAARERVTRYFHQRNSAENTIAIYRQVLNGIRCSTKSRSRAALRDGTKPGPLVG
jgi:glycosyltransferase involved in cell wall biosynthesis